MVLGVHAREERSSEPTLRKSLFGPLVGTVSWVWAGPPKRLFLQAPPAAFVGNGKYPPVSRAGTLHTENQMWMDSRLWLSYPLRSF